MIASSARQSLPGPQANPTQASDSPAAPTATEIDCDSLLLFIPLLLGKRLPQAVITPLVARLREPGHFLTTHGLASESTSSQFYQPDGYWRGPLWGAPMVMLVEGLAAVGETELAADLRRRFCALVTARGLAENYDALTGAPLRDRAFTWTASAFLLLAAELAQPGQTERLARR